MLDISLGFPEVLTLAIIGVLLFGPDKLPELAQKLGRVINYVRGIANTAREQLHEELPELKNVNLADLNPKTMVGKVFDETTAGIWDEATAGVLNEAKSEIRELASADIFSATAASQQHPAAETETVPEESSDDFDIEAT
ncbi:MAG: Sec-independent protein translocase subunit TatB [Propionibacteriaceae bacterium]|nr:Sec-independent protein translocase subunit TatB [Propionibacteriaceae bacterium]